MNTVGTIGTSIDLRAELRKHIPVAQKWAYFDHAAVGPIPEPSAKAMRRWCDEACFEGDVMWPRWAGLSSKMRDRAAAMISATPEEIALVPNTTFGINIVASGFPWKCGDSVVFAANEFPSNYLPWQSLSRRGVDVRKVQVSASGLVSLDELSEAIDKTTRIVSLSWVGYASGYRLDLAKVCELVHERGALLFVDAIQGLGVFPLNVESVPIDFLAADGHKWLLGPEGAGLLYIRHDRLDRIEPNMIGWGSVTSAGDFRADGAVLKPSASRFEGGSANHVGQIGLGESIQLLTEHGVGPNSSRIGELVLENADLIEDGLLRIGAEVFRPRLQLGDDRSLSGIVSFQLPKVDSRAVRQQLLDAGVVTSVRHDRLRVATHAYNNQSDIERLLVCLHSMLRG